MATINPIKLSTDTQSHLPTQAGDTIPTDMILISTDAGNVIDIGTDGGLLVKQADVGGAVEGVSVGDSASVAIISPTTTARVPIADALMLGGVSLDVDGHFIIPTSGMYEIAMTAFFSFGAAGPGVLHRGTLGGYVTRENSDGTVGYTYMLFGLPVVYTATGGFEGEFPNAVQSGSVHVVLNAGDKVGAMLESTQIFGDAGLPITGVVKQLYVRLIHG